MTVRITTQGPQRRCYRIPARSLVHDQRYHRRSHQTAAPRAIGRPILSWHCACTGIHLPQFSVHAPDVDYRAPLVQTQLPTVLVSILLMLLFYFCLVTTVMLYNACAPTHHSNHIPLNCRPVIFSPTITRRHALPRRLRHPSIPAHHLEPTLSPITVFHIVPEPLFILSIHCRLVLTSSLAPSPFHWHFTILPLRSTSRAHLIGPSFPCCVLPLLWFILPPLTHLFCLFLSTTPYATMLAPSNS